MGLCVGVGLWVRLLAGWCPCGVLGFLWRLQCVLWLRVGPLEFFLFHVLVLLSLSKFFVLFVC